MQIHTEFENVDGRTFITGSNSALANLFGRDLKRETRQGELGKTAQRLATVFAAIKSRPASITVRVPTELPDLPNSEARRTVCKYGFLNSLHPMLICDKACIRQPRMGLHVVGSWLLVSMTYISLLLMVRPGHHVRTLRPGYLCIQRSGGDGSRQAVKMGFVRPQSVQWWRL